MLSPPLLKMVLELSPANGLVTTRLHVRECLLMQSLAQPFRLSPGDSASCGQATGQADTFRLSELNLTRVFFKTCTVKCVNRIQASVFKSADPTELVLILFPSSEVEAADTASDYTPPECKNAPPFLGLFIYLLDREHR